ncbi:MAG: 4Fe-4S dicluster domain-containing protein, partial [Caldilineaceae bacterium]|nr:4Fe-4S dicluster domain-containing protein [Caldilineaceae bacterium]
CRRCADNCPVKAIPQGAPSAERHNQSNIQGVRKWSVDGEKCFGYWAAQNSDCSICIRVCPYNKDYSQWWHRVGRRLAGTPLRGLLLALDQRLGFGERMKPVDWWAGKREGTITRLRRLLGSK